MPRLPPDEIARLKRLVVLRVREGEAVVRVMAALGLGRGVAQYWASRDAEFRAQLSQALETGRHRRMWSTDAARMAAFVAGVRGGARVAEPWGRPGMPGRATYFHWKATDAGFAEEMRRIRDTQRAAMVARGKAAARPYDPELAEVIYARLRLRGSMPKALAGDDRLPCATIVRRWRREQPEFDAMIRAAMVGWRSRCARERTAARAGKVRWPWPWPETKCAPEMIGRVIEHVAYGGTLASAAREPGMPHPRTLYRWMYERPDFACAVLTAYDDRDAGDLHELVGPVGGAGPMGNARRRAQRLIGGRGRRPGLSPRAIVVRRA